LNRLPSADGQEARTAEANELEHLQAKAVRLGPVEAADEATDRDGHAGLQWCPLQADGGQAMMLLI
jgi:hypothetical protein